MSIFRLWKLQKIDLRFTKSKYIAEGMRIFPTLHKSTSSADSGPNKPNADMKGNKILETDLSAVELDRIRNFSIIAHIDHGKSTLADCMLEYVGAITKRTKQNDRILDKLQVERERGITVKAQTATVIYQVRNRFYL